jgi:hypothetical protein
MATGDPVSDRVDALGLDDVTDAGRQSASAQGDQHGVERIG